MLQKKTSLTETIKALAEGGEDLTQQVHQHLLAPISSRAT